MRGGAPASPVAKRERRGELLRPVPAAGVGDFVQLHGAADFVQRPVDVGAVEEPRQDILPVAEERRRREHAVNRTWDDTLALERTGGLLVELFRIGRAGHRLVDGNRALYVIVLPLPLRISKVGRPSG